MKTYYTYIFLLTVWSLFAGCEKVIDIRLKDVDARYVIEGVITTQAGTCKVLISKTRTFDNANGFEGVSGATVQIESKGIVNKLTETAKGIYQAPALTGRQGNTYNLTVNINGQVFTSSSVMPQRVPLDDVYLTTDNFDKKLRHLNVNYKDPAQTRNYYRFIQYINKEKSKNITIDNDEFTNGQEVNTELDFSSDNGKDWEIKTGDTLEVEMLCIDAPVYSYWYSLEGANGRSDSASPANPVSNIKGGALGYFSAHTFQRRGIIAP